MAQQHRGQYSCFVDPRISFSNDLAAKQEVFKYKEAPVSSDFEFCVKNYAMIPADEIFLDGVMLPLKEEEGDDRGRKMTTLREEQEGECGLKDSSKKKTKGSSWWKERLGLIRSKKDPKRAGLAAHY